MSPWDERDSRWNNREKIRGHFSFFQSCKYDWNKSFLFLEKLIAPSAEISLAFQISFWLSVKGNKENKISVHQVHISFLLLSPSQSVLLKSLCFQEIPRITRGMVLCLFHLLNQWHYSSFLLILPSYSVLSHHLWAAIFLWPPSYINYFLLTYLPEQINLGDFAEA